MSNKESLPFNNRECVTHHYACDCREEKFKQLERENAELKSELVRDRESSDNLHKSVNSLLIRLGKYDELDSESDVHSLNYTRHEQLIKERKEFK